MFPPDTRILIADDMMTMRKLVKKALTELGFTKITEAENGAKALEKFREAVTAGAPFQLIISDWNMPEMTGIDFLKKVRETQKTLPFVLVTAESEKSQVIEALQAKVSGYIVKPFTAQQIGDKLKAIHTAITGAPKAA